MSSYVIIHDRVIKLRILCEIDPITPSSLHINELVNIFINTNCTGLYIDEDNPSLHMLMFADDILFINDTVGRLQKHLNSLFEFCSKYDFCKHE